MNIIALLFFNFKFLGQMEDPQVDQSDIESDRILPDPTIRRNPIGFRVSESLTDPMNGFFVGFRRTVRRNPIKSDPKDPVVIPKHGIQSNPTRCYRILWDSYGFRWVPYWIRSDSVSDSSTWDKSNCYLHQCILIKWCRRAVYTVWELPWAVTTFHSVGKHFK